MRQFYGDLIESFELEPEFKAAAVMLKVAHPDGDGLGASVLALEKQARMYNTGHMRHQLKKWGLDAALVHQMASDYWNALHNIDARFNADGISSPLNYAVFGASLMRMLDGIGWLA